jgi:hypothetical protein
VGSGVTTSHVYREARTYTVTVSVADDTGRRGSAARLVEVVDATPVAVVVEVAVTDDAGRTGRTAERVIVE